MMATATEYRIDDRSEGVPDSECYFAIVEEGQETIDILGTRDAAVKGINLLVIESPVLVIVPRWGRRLEMWADPVDSSQSYRQLLWADGSKSELSDCEADAPGCK